MTKLMVTIISDSSLISDNFNFNLKSKMKLLRNVMTVIVFATFMIFLYTQRVKKDYKIMRAFDWLISKSDYQGNYIEQIKNLCGDLCDFKKEIIPGKFMGSVKAKVMQNVQSKLSHFHVPDRL